MIFYDLVLLAILPLVLALYAVIQLATYTVVLTDTEIYTRGQFGWGKLQYPVKVKYCDITNLEIKASHKNSLGKTSGFTSNRTSMPCLFLKIYTKGKKGSTNILIEFFSVKQRKQILKMICDNSNLNITYEILEPKCFL